MVSDLTGATDGFDTTLKSLDQLTSLTSWLFNSFVILVMVILVKDLVMDIRHTDFFLAEIKCVIKLLSVWLGYKRMKKLY